jgi:hypothetical protein
VAVPPAESVVGPREVPADGRLGGPPAAGSADPADGHQADAGGIKVIKRRWVVERTFAWLGQCRRLGKEYEGATGSSEACVKLAMIQATAAVW